MQTKILHIQAYPAVGSWFWRIDLNMGVRPGGSLDRRSAHGGTPYNRGQFDLEGIRLAVAEATGQPLVRLLAEGRQEPLQAVLL
jgi:hypothetical protein